MVYFAHKQPFFSFVSLERDIYFPFEPPPRGRWGEGIILSNFGESFKIEKKRGKKGEKRGKKKEKSIKGRIMTKSDT